MVLYEVNLLLLLLVVVVVVVVVVIMNRALDHLKISSNPV